MKSLQTLTAIIEAVAGLALLIFPSATASVLLGMPLDQSAASSLARVGGAAVLALAIVCWLTPTDAKSQTSRGLIVAILLYNFTVAGVLVLASVGDELARTVAVARSSFSCGDGCLVHPSSTELRFRIFAIIR
jgi:hypothetical protein